MKPLLSIIIPFYGTADKKMLERCIASIRNQGMETEDYEILIEDDNGKGLGGARNIGIGKARGEYLLFIDADDYLFPGMLAQCMVLLTQHPDMISFGFQQVSHSNETVRSKEEATSKTYPTGAAFMNEHNFMGTAWRHLFLKEWLLKHQLVFPENAYHEDEAFVAKAYFHAGTTIITNLTVYAYYQCPHSILHKQDVTNRTQRIQNFRQILTDLKKYLKETAAEASPQQQRALQRRIHFLTIDYILQLIHNHYPLLGYPAALKELKKHQFLPLPNEKYSWKYSIARIPLNLFALL
ncbi:MULTISPECIES: glycosyltransferase [Bacteroides]|uniref:glycosyltransferase family 2 protein n=1 Tax=Bacteroides TaxID=816 RepID=UPI002A8268CB|nr:glycosyltransferase [Bacteroides nordii]